LKRKFSNKKKLLKNLALKNKRHIFAAANQNESPTA
jgi:hypothetical protein